ncbi:acylphosphatase [Aquibium sp. LZ166]|uniref:Acylphosphatase n=1 Tax=Aquibium pacificus TaxID=3153579 RepID=A0ABV3SD87_9HYPH
MSDTKTVRVRVTGRVQGVSFRWWTRREALGLGLTGWVRNEEDGSVRALLHGAQDVVHQMLDRLRHGPPGARVDDVTVEEEGGGEVPAGFEILR